MPALAIVAMLIFTGLPSRGAEEKTKAIEGKLRTLESEVPAGGAGSAAKENWQEVDLRFAALVAEEPGNLPVRLARAEFLWNQGQALRALAEWQAIEKINPRFAPALDRLADYWLNAGDVKRAASYFSRAVESEPTHAAYRFALANVTFLFRHDLTTKADPGAESMLTNALTQFAEAARLSPLNEQYARAYAETFYALPDPDWTQARTAWEHVLEITPQKDFARVNLARVHLKLGNPEAAERALAEVQDHAFDSLKTRLRARMPAAAKP